MFKQAVRSQSRLRLTLDGPAGSGKAQPLDVNILTPLGWRQMGEMRIGDEVIDPDGGIAYVTGVYPRGEMDVYCITMSDGSQTRCSGDHLWLTQNTLDRSAFNGDHSRYRAKVRTTSEISTSLTKKGKRNYTIPMMVPCDLGQGKELPINPYLLGLLLGNACFQEKCVLFSSGNQETLATLNNLLPNGVTLRHTAGYDYGLRRVASSGTNPLLDIMRNLGLAGHKSTEKFIPPEFLWTSATNRAELLRGLLDTDGYADHHTAEYSTSSPQLAKDVEWLVQSLGGTCVTSTKIPKYVYNGENKTGSTSYRMYICPPYGINPFGVTTKADRFRPRSKYPARRFIEIVEYCGVAPVQCITVNSKRNLYVTDDFIVTHNSYTALRFAHSLAAGERIAVIDTERGSASKYVGESPDGIPWAFDVVEPADFSPERYTEMIELAGRSGYKVLIIDSLSHAWSGKGGALEMKDRISDRPGENNWTAWRPVTPIHRRMIDAILQSPCHVITTMRSKMEYVQEFDEKKGKVTIRRVGMAPDQRPMTEYEFDIVCDIDWAHIMTVTKSRCSAVDGLQFEKPGPLFMERVLEWLNSGKASGALPPVGQIANGVLVDSPVPYQVQPSMISLTAMLDRYSVDEIIAAGNGRIPATNEEVAAVLATLEGIDT